ncbi:LysM peptidoglycan-binding domain-containing protein [Brevibacterium yomogidense]|uniref:LysM peptidoglycan-binding domain-containing protein n=1 Tax=Brevibacterium yomogidense TaxID=946573 RepID=UPI0018DFA78A|nr:LysM domain-containing protein [Brevibacterium yomogidense]
MGMRRLTLFAAAHAAGTTLLLCALPRLAAEALAGDPGAALLLIAGAATVLAGVRTTVSVLLAHLWRLCTAAGLAAAPIRAAALRTAPRAARTALSAAVGGSLSVAVLAGPAFAASPSPAWPLSPAPADDTALSDDPTPSDDSAHSDGTAPLDEDASRAQGRGPAWPLSQDAASPPPTTPDRAPAPGSAAAPDDAASVHVVAPGDSMWRIVASELPGAAPAEVATRVADVHAANRELVGDDANLILPGQRLVLP